MVKEILFVFAVACLVMYVYYFIKAWRQEARKDRDKR
jgi:hypothetical protein